MKERKGYRNQLAEIKAETGGKELLNIADVAKYTKCDRRTVRKLFQFGASGYITATGLAQQMCERCE